MFLKTFKDVECLSETGSEFHNLGADTENERKRF